jgi:prephenate dehydrogenase
MATIKIGILGLGRIGTSLALALQHYGTQKEARHTFEMTCADLRVGVREDAAKKLSGVRIDRDIYAAASGQDIVVIALPYAEVQYAYRDIANEVRGGAVVLDMSPLKQPSMEWAAKYLKPGAHQIGLTPVINARYLFDGLDDTLHAQPDLFQKGTMLIMPTASAAREAVELASDFSTILGATPHFFDPAEHDSLVALTESLPALLGVTTFYAASRSAGWDDVQRVTNSAFGQLTHHLYDTHPDDLRDMLLNQRVEVVAQLDQLLLALDQMRDVLKRGDQAALEVALGRASESYSAWINKRTSGRWDQEQEADAPSLGSTVLTGLMGGYLARKLQGEKKG